MNGDGRIGEHVALRASARWLIEEWQWPYAGALAGAFLLCVFPVLWSAEGLALALVFLQLPVYLVHQLEEHAGDRFRRYVNERMGGGRELLSRPLTFWVNALCVWLLDVTVFLLAAFVDLGLGLIAIYVTAVNAFTHVAAAVATRSYGPGLWTAILLFVPAAAAGAVEVIDAADPGLGQQLLAVGIAVGLHVALIGLILRRLAALRAAPA